MGEAVALVGYHIALEGIHTDLYDHELWRLWREQVRQASFWHDNSDVLEEVMRHVRGEA